MLKESVAQAGAYDGVMRACLLAALVIAALALHVASAGASVRASLVAKSMSPLTLKGSGFGPRERVRVTVTSGDGTSRAKRVRARSGGFVVTFRRADASCGVEAAAVGRRGSRASFTLSTFACPG